MIIKNRLRRAIILWSKPKDYLYSFLISNQKIVRQKPFDPLAKKAAVKLSNKIARKCPGLETNLFGSLGMEIPGHNDIDLFVAGKPALVHKYAKYISKIAGCEGKHKKDFIIWRFIYLGFPVELILISAESRHFLEQKYLFETIKNDRNILEAYKTLKKSLDGGTQRDYVVERMLFFNKLIADRNNKVDLGRWSLVTSK